MMKIPLSGLLSLAALLPCTSATEYWTRGVTKESGWYDANKNFTNVDSNLCWAATSSNLINWWQNQYEIVNPSIPQGDDIWKTYKSAFSNGPAELRVGLLWWFSGSFAQDTGDVAYLKNSSYGGYYKNIGLSLSTMIPSSVGPSYVIPNMAKTLSSYIKTTLSSNAAIGLSIHDAGNTFGHAITLWGINYDSDTKLINKMWVTDSDDRVNGLVEMDVYVDSSNRLAFKPVLQSSFYTEETTYYIFDVFSLQSDDKVMTLKSPDVVDLIIPEPTTATLILLALSAVAFRRSIPN